MVDELVVVVKVSDLLEKLKSNLEEHRRIYNEAMAAYRVEAEKQLLERLETIKSGKELNNMSLYFNLPFPQKHDKEYEVAISMFEMTMQAGESTVKLTQTHYRQLVLDEWGWSHSFVGTASMYSNLARSKLQTMRGMDD